MIVIPQCSHCKHFRKERVDGNFCNAFPDEEGIPREILLNEFDHTKEHEGDHGIRFEEENS